MRMLFSIMPGFPDIPDIVFLSCIVRKIGQKNQWTFNTSRVEQIIKNWSEQREKIKTKSPFFLCQHNGHVFLQSDNKRVKIRFRICSLLLETLPYSYKEESKYCFWYETNRQNQTILEAFQYFLGGLEYRIEKIFFALSNVLAISLGLIMKQVEEGINSFLNELGGNIYGILK